MARNPDPRRNFRLGALLLPFVLVAGCTQGPDYVRPQVTPPATFRAQTSLNDAGSLADLLTREAVRSIEQRDKAKPLFLYLAYHSPHTPLECPPEYAKPYAHLGPQREDFVPCRLARLVRRLDRFHLGIAARKHV